MIGMMNFDFGHWVLGCALACMAGAASARADVVTLTSGAERLTGVLRSIGDDGVAELESELSHERLRLRGAMIEKVEFDAVAQEPEVPSARIELINGDVIPCSVLEMDGNQVLAESPVLGKLRIERRHLAAMHFGIHAPKLVYAGPNDSAEWPRMDEENSGWNFAKGELVAEGRAFSSRDIGFPERFEMNFEMEWERNKMPSLQVYFCDPLVAMGERCDRYYLQYGSAGLELKRESAKDRRYTTIAFVNRLPGECADRKLRVGLQVDRRNSILRLMLDGKHEGEFKDPVGSVPTGGGMALVSQAPDGVVQWLRGIEVRESDVAPQRQDAERRHMEDRESLITRKGERWTGELLGMSTKGDARVMKFRSQFATEPLELPEADVLSVFFPQPSETETSSSKVLYLLTYAGDGKLRIASCHFAADAATMDHPLLGSLKLGRNSLRFIERAVPNGINSVSE